MSYFFRHVHPPSSTQPSFSVLNIHFTLHIPSFHNPYFTKSMDQSSSLSQYPLEVDVSSKVYPKTERWDLTITVSLNIPPPNLTPSLQSSPFPQSTPNSTLLMKFYIEEPYLCSVKQWTFFFAPSTMLTPPTRELIFTQSSPSNLPDSSNPSTFQSNTPPNFGRILRSNDGTFSMESTIDVHSISNNNSLVSSFMTIPFQLVESKLKKVFEDAVANNLYFIRS